MNSSIKNIFSFIKEVILLKNKNIYDVNDYEINLDINDFYNKYSNIISKKNLNNINIFSHGSILELKYIDDSKRKEYPRIPNILEHYIELNKDNDVIDKRDNIQEELKDNNLLEYYYEYKKIIEDINRDNHLIDSYNKLYLDLYKVYKRIKDYEEKIEVIMGTNLLVWKSNDGNFIKRHILEATLDLDVDATNNVIKLSINEDKFRGFVIDFLNYNQYEIKDNIHLYDFIKDTNDKINNEEVDLKELVEKYIKIISYNNSIEDSFLTDINELKSNYTYLFNNVSIIVRNKNVKLWIDDLEKIISACDKENFLSPVLNMFEVDFNEQLQVDNLLNDSTYKDYRDEDVLFPLPANREQYKIVDKVRSSNIVLVQGPPGTGKSHTITNLISHYISQGKRVIVTSEKAKALEVLRDKIPEEIRSLSLALLTSSGIDKNLEFSIETVLKHQTDEEEQKKQLKKIEELTNKLEDVYKRKIENHKKIVDLMSKDTINYHNELNDVMGSELGNNCSLMEIAKWLDRNKSYRIINCNDNENYDYPDINEFFEKLDDICDIIRNNHYAISTEVPKNTYLENNLIDLHIKENNSYQKYVIKNDNLYGAIIVDECTYDKVKELSNIINDIKIIYNYFDKEWLKNNLGYDVLINQLKEVIDVINKQKKLIYDGEILSYDNKLTYDKKTRAEYLNTIEELLALYDENDSLSLVDKIRIPLILKKMENLKINNFSLNKDNCSKINLIRIKTLLSYDFLIEGIRDKIIKLLKIDLFKLLNIGDYEFGKYQDRVINILTKLISFNNDIKKIDLEISKIINTNIFPVSYISNSNDFIDSVLSDLNYYVGVNCNLNKTNDIVKDIREFYNDYNLCNLSKYITSIEDNNLEEYLKNKEELLKEIQIINLYNSLKKKYNSIMVDKADFVSKYIYEFDNNTKQFIKNNIDSILKYHYVENFYLLTESRNNDLPELFELRENLILEEKRIISDLIAEKGWYYQSSSMTSNISASLSKWLGLKKKLGAGTGKNANLYLKQMRAEMQVAKDAIPVWIMPIDKLIEQYPFKNDPPFDVLIMDESSQSSMFSISALTRAKKVIIVGDDKQISPTSAFSKLDDITDLRTKYLKDNYWSLQIAKDTSIYDIIQTICGNKKITLTEHFRCLPEIIHYSNREFYNMQIKPLKVRSKENTIELPIKTVYVPNATCKKVGSQVYNEAEINRIIDLITEISNDKQYNNKTIGIIALQNSTRYIQKIIELLIKNFGEKFIREREIKVGNTYDFQGDERDVIILSMIISSTTETGEKYQFRALTTEEFKKSFNVATSRAKEQMILVHSVKLEELSVECNRYKLLNYCINYRNEKSKEVEVLFESNFERDIYHVLKSYGIELTPQVKVGGYRLDFTVTNDKNQKIVIECDGDRYHGINELEHDLDRQSVLERCGWKFVRIRASEFYYNREESINNLINQIETLLGNEIRTFNEKSDTNNNYENNIKTKVLDIFPSINENKTYIEKNNVIFPFIDNNDTINKDIFD